MPLKTYQNPPDALGFIANWRQTNSVSSPRVKGKLILRNQPYLLLAGALGPQRFNKGFDTWCWKKAHSGADVHPQLLRLLKESELERSCYSKLRGKLYQGSASLGVTLASVKQSREMIANRYKQLTTRADAVFADLLYVEMRHGKSSVRYLERIAGFHLEVIFGWTPLLVDIHTAATKVIQLADASEFVSVSAQSDGFHVSGMDSWFGECRVSYSSAYRISNPNAWLAERAGLLNPATVAWDLVPWSFVVNMFVNTGQLVQSITDFTGLQFMDMHKTTTYRYRAVRQKPLHGVFSSMSGIDKRRGPSSMPPVPNLRFRLPDANWETAAMAASLLTQRFGPLAANVRATSTYKDAVRFLRKRRKRNS